MKIIGKTDDTGYIITASQGELGMLENTYSKSNLPYAMGTTIDVSAMYEQVRRLKEHKSEMEQAQKMLRMIADNLEVLTPIVAPEEEAKQGGEDD